MTSIGADIDHAAEILRRGGLVSIPTETVYGLAANALNPEAVTQIFEVKKRPTFDPLIVHLSENTDPVEYVSEFPREAELLADKFWPGPLTMVLPKRSLIPDIVTSGLETVGIRKPRHELTQKLLSVTGFPLSAPSANLFGRVSPTMPQHVYDQLGDKVDYILDGGDCAVGVESTIIGWDDGEITVYRLGGVTLEEIEGVVGKVKKRMHSSSRPDAPGMLTSHYAPDVRLHLGIPDNPTDDPGTGFLLYSGYLEGVSKNRQWILSESGDLKDAARNLFRILRDLDKFELETVYVELVPETGLGRAINDRLRRACSS